MYQKELNEDLFQAAKIGDVVRVQTLLQSRSTHAGVRFWNEMALRGSAAKGYTETVKVLLQAGADVHASSESALRFAARKGHTATVQVLLQAGADVHAEKDKALRYAAKNGHVSTVQVLLQPHSTYGFTHCADVHAKEDEALRYAAKNGHAAMVELLLQAGADSSFLSIPELKLFLTPKFILSLPEEILAGIENCHPEVKKYEWGKKRNSLNCIKEENSFDAKISLADFYYRPGAPGYYQAISFN